MRLQGEAVCVKRARSISGRGLSQTISSGATGSERLLVYRQGKRWVAIYGDPAHPARLVAATRSQVMHRLERLLAAA
jgi:hypothetical protein